MLEHKARQEICNVMRELKARGLNRGAEGNVSMRFEDGFLITPSGVLPEDMVPDQIVRVDMEGNFSGAWKPSSEWRMHRDIYRERAEAGAVIHTHSTHATALSCLQEPIPPFHYMIALAGGAVIDCAPYATFGSEELSRNMLKGLGPRQATLLANHGMICFKETLGRALVLAETVEELARQYLLAKAVGEPRRLSDDEMARVLKKFADHGQPGQKG